MRISDWSADVCSSDLYGLAAVPGEGSAVARLYLAVEAARRGEFAETIAKVDSLDDNRLNQALRPILAGWAEFGRGDLAAAEERLAGLAEDPGFAALYALHAAMLAEASGRPDEAARRYEAALSAQESPPLRLRLAAAQIGRASCRERVWQYVGLSVVAGSLKKKKI